MEVRDFLKVDLEHEASSVSKIHQEELIRSLKTGIPFAYLLQEVEFYYHRFFVSDAVLIPRPETEYLVELIVNEFKEKSKRILDVGTGSGVLLLCLLDSHVGETGVGVDISQKALDVAMLNASRLHLEAQTSFLLSDRLQKVQGTFDLIVSNPPYIKAEAHNHLVHPSVDRFEPHEALYLPDDKYDQWFEEFFLQIRSQLNGTFFMEGHELELEAQADTLRRLGFREVEVLKDLSGVNRFLRARHG